MSGTRTAIKLLEEHSDHAAFTLLTSALLYTTTQMKAVASEASQSAVHHATNVAGGLYIAGTYLAGALKHVAAFSDIAEYSGRFGPVTRSWRSYVSGGLVALSGAAGGAALYLAGEEQPVASMATATASGLLFYASGCFHQAEAKAAKHGQLPPSGALAEQLREQLVKDDAREVKIDIAQLRNGYTPG